MWKTPSTPSIPRLIASASDRSPSTSSTPLSSNPVALLGVLTSATTSSPRSRRRLITREPMNPVPPVTNALMGAESNGHILSGDGSRPQRQNGGVELRRRRVQPARASACPVHSGVAGGARHGRAARAAAHRRRGVDGGSGPAPPDARPGHLL